MSFFIPLPFFHYITDLLKSIHYCIIYGSILCDRKQDEVRIDALNIIAVRINQMLLRPDSWWLEHYGNNAY